MYQPSQMRPRIRMAISQCSSLLNRPKRDRVFLIKIIRERRGQTPVDNIRGQA